MLRAEQLALIQEANQQLLAIRQQEMQYYVNTFSSFGTQGSLIAGFTLGALVGLDVRDFEVHGFWKGLFWISSSVAMASSIHCILTTTFANIYGPNLALRGPSGSMVRAVKGMIAEKSGIFMSFIMCLIAFQLMTLAVTWVMMETYSSAVSTVVLLVGGLYWYKYCLRIYNRFKFIEPDIEWRNSDAGSEMLRSTDTFNERPGDDNSDKMSDDRVKQQSADSFKISSNPQQGMSMHNQQSITEGLITQQTTKVNKRSSVMNMFKRKESSNANVVQEGSQVSNVMHTSDTPAPTQRLFMEGYLSKMGDKGMMSSKPDWSRKYFVLKGSDMFYYKSREDFEADPSKSIKNRPIGVSRYVLKKISDKDRPPFEFELKPESDDDDRRLWRFRCDTVDEMKAWMDAFAVAVKM
mmetsp:Transcript_27981/g.47271  ORF Transcript_27981/g.47271 Transcript_27981/m.47271 type:complete len:408 (+) Transcript_27981:107-1330(+)|eukprot:CAMPEP_0114425690 /NCGR_PEP_ID=MMETSP0103-20121206/7375_1 /TAXON_ID=37642 ORGANISM="Paraphysomonas imperforata, Strain PA2" /NCGR_SAMPLE_ID=MMETSP0103 /ASSEMBLY_ACC=CAM_ASM_000201 /LENGTH=407 /DNA_ID=CAMNT_0001594553 /DNA_START=101 /DNA_END=1324 /DNA_ORIENTATION=-